MKIYQFIEGQANFVCQEVLNNLSLALNEPQLAALH